MEIQKIILDQPFIAICKSLKEFFEKGVKNYVFYNIQDGKSLNRDTLFKLIYFLEKYYPSIVYKFYNVPFCVFTKLGKSFIDHHCIRNKLCNSYDGYTHENKCLSCEYALFCNNFNSRIPSEEKSLCEPFITDKMVTRAELLEKINIFKNFVKDMGYQDEEITFYITQKYMYFLCIGTLEAISQSFLKYLIVYCVVGNKKLNKKFFEPQNGGILIWKDVETGEKSLQVIQKNGIGLNFTNDVKDLLGTKKIYHEKIELRFDEYLSIGKYIGKRPFFDFALEGIFFDKNTREFVGKVHQKKDIVITGKVHIIRSANDAQIPKGNIYVARDVISGMGIHHYDVILLTGDNLGNRSRFKSAQSNITQPVIYNIAPNIVEILQTGESVSIDFNTGVITRCR